MIIVLKPHASEDHILRVEELIKKKDWKHTLSEVKR